MKDEGVQAVLADEAPAANLANLAAGWTSSDRHSQAFGAVCDFHYHYYSLTDPTTSHECFWSSDSTV